MEWTPICQALNIVVISLMLLRLQNQMEDDETLFTFMYWTVQIKSLYCVCQWMHVCVRCVYVYVPYVCTCVCASILPPNPSILNTAA